MDPLEPFGRQEKCWCGSGRTYRMCHHRWAVPQSAPGAPVPSDSEGGIFLSPTVKLAESAIAGMMPGGAPIYLDKGERTVRPVQVSEFERYAAGLELDDDTLRPRELGLLRAELVGQLMRLPDDDEPISETVGEGVARAAILGYQTALSLTNASPGVTVLWNEDLAPSLFLARTLLLADYVLTPDRLFEALAKRPTNRALRAVALADREYVPLYSAGRAIPVPSGVAVAAASAAVGEMVRGDLANERLFDFVRRQLVVEGPTAREVLFVNARDDLVRAPHMWMYGHIQPPRVSDSAGDGAEVPFETRMLQPYDATFDYRPWIDQVTRAATGTYLQRTAKRLSTASLLGAEYVAASPFDARVMRARANSAQFGTSTAAVWAGVPVFENLNSKDLASILNNEEAVEDLRAQMRLAMRGALDLQNQADALSHVSAEIEHASHALERRVRRDRIFAAALPAVFGAAGVVVGAAGGIAGIAAGTLGVMAGLAPYLGTRANDRSEAPFLYVMARKRERRNRR